jgi:hypothetical protein
MHSKGGRLSYIKLGLCIGYLYDHFKPLVVASLQAGCMCTDEVGYILIPYWALLSPHYLVIPSC